MKSAEPAAPHADDPAAARAGGVLSVDLDALAGNYRRLCRELSAGTECAAVVKADGYGLGVDRVAPVLAAAGARRFFVATIDEGLTLRRVLAEAGWPGAEIFVLNGPLPGTERDFQQAGLTPVLNSLADLQLWQAAAKAAETALPAAVHLDTGMSRLGLPDDEIDTLAADPGRLDGIALTHWITHLASASSPDDPENAAQRSRFEAALAKLPPAAASFANSSGVFLGAPFHHELARPGVALYGVNPTPHAANPMARVVTLRARILQVRQIDAGRGVGYGSSFRAPGPTRIATIAAGYADGLLRHLSNRGRVAIGGRLAPVVGRVSMDSITVDASALPAEAVQPGAWAELIGASYDQDALAEDAGTIGYEVLTALGGRYHRVYTARSTGGGDRGTG
jgi:alanine racemase